MNIKMYTRKWVWSSVHVLVMLFFAVQAMAIPPAITTQPLSQAKCVSNNVTFSIGATDATSYQWQINTGGGFVNVTNGGIYSGATTTTLLISSVSLGMDGFLYRCIATGPDNPPATSNNATLTVNSDATVVTQPTTPVTICSGGNASFSVVAGGNVSGYQWYSVDGGGGVTPLTNTGVYSGVNTATLSITGITVGGTAQTFSYFCAISGACAGVNTNTCHLEVNALPAITAQPQNDTICNGNTASFSVTTTGTGLTYQWQQSYNGTTWNNLANNATYNDVTTSGMTVVGNPTIDNTQYRCVVTGTCTPPATSADAVLDIKPIMQIVTHPADAKVCPNGGTTFTIAGNGSNPVYQWQLNTGSGWANIANGGVYTGATTSLLKLTNIPQTYTQYRYRCVISDDCTGGLPSNEATLTVDTPLSITAQPVNSQTICSGGSASYTVAAQGSGTPVTYQWYSVDGGGNATAMTNGGVYSGVTSATLMITGITAPTAQITESYFCAVSGSCTGANSNTVTLTVNALPNITAQPQNDTVCNGNGAVFSISTTGTALTYQWQRSFDGTTWTNLSNNAIYSNVNTSGLSIVSDLTIDQSMYRCVVNGACTPQVISTPARLTVYPILYIATQPQDEQVCPNSNIAFSATGVGVNVTYQWQLNTGSGWSDVINGGVYSGASAQNLLLTNIPQSYSQYRYRCLVGGECSGLLVSNEAMLTVDTPISITMQPAVNTTICSGGNASYTIAAQGSGTPVTYQWYSVSGGTSTALTNTGVYSGVTTPTLNITGITSATSATTYSYFCAVLGSCAGATSNTLQLTVNALPNISMQPMNATVCAGGTTSFTINATGTGITYQWQVNTGSSWMNVTNGGIYSNATTNTLLISGVSAMQNGYQYRCMVNGVCAPAATSNAAVLSVNTAPVVTSQPVNSTICMGDNTSFSVAATGAGLTYQWQVNDNSTGWMNVTNTGIYSNATTATLNITGAGANVNNYKYRMIVNGTCVPNATSAMAALTINTPPVIATQPVNMATCPGGNAMFSVVATGTALTYQWQVNTGSGWTNLSNTGIYSGVTTASMSITGAGNMQNGYQYRVMISGTCTPAATSNAVTLNINTLPAITTQPVSQVVCLNGGTSYTVAATGTALTYQWQLSTNGTTWSNVANGTNYSGATMATLNVSSAPSVFNGNMYRCMVSGACTPAVVSSAASLTVNPPTAISSNPSNVTICPSSGASFSVSATGTNVTYQWQVNTGSSWANVANGGVYSGATTNKLSLTNVQSSFNGNMYRCVVSGNCAPLTLTSGMALLTVHSNVVITTQPAPNTTICSGTGASLSVVATGTGISYQWYEYIGSSFVPVTNGGVYSGATTATLTISGLTTTGTAKTHIYYCKVNGTCNSPSTSTANVHVQAKPAITSNPTNKSVCDSVTNVDFNTTAVGTNLTYQWQVNTGSGWSNISNGATYSGATANQLVVTQALFAMNGYQYRCVVSGSCTPAVASTSATLSVTPIVPVIAGVTASDTDICTGSFVSFNASVANGGTNPSYQWKVNGNNVGSNSASFGSNSLSDIDIVSCQVTSNTMCPRVATVLSNQVTMHVTAYQAPQATITSSTGNSACDGAPVTFTPAVTWGGSSPSYQWQVNGVPVTATTNYTTDTLDSNDVVRCIVTSNFKCPQPQVVSSNNIVMKIHQVGAATVTISENSDTIVCQNQPVKIHASYTNSGINPQFEWVLNGNTLSGPNNATYNTSAFINGDVIQCRFISSEVCVPPVLSAPLTVSVETPRTPVVDVAVSYNGDNSYTFTAIPTFGGTQPQYEWLINGAITHFGSTYTSPLLTKNDKVTVTMTSNYFCLTTATANSRVVTTSVGNNGISFEELTLYPNPNSGTFKVSGVYNGTGNATVHIDIMNALGQSVHQTEAEVVSGKLEHVVNMNGELTPGVYIIRIKADGMEEVRRFNISR